MIETFNIVFFFMKIDQSVYFKIKLKFQ